MFPGGYFAKTMFTGFYFQPVDGGTPIVSDENHLVGMLVNFGTMMGRR